MLLWRSCMRVSPSLVMKKLATSGLSQACVHAGIQKEEIKSHKYV